MKGDALDPKALIREAYNIDGISASQCRSIFLDWALSLPGEIDQQDAIRQLHGRYAPSAPEHPMTGVLQDGMQKLSPSGRRGGRGNRVRH